MKRRHLIALAMTILACAGVVAAAPRVSFQQQSSPSMPPRLVADCVTYALIDNKCTADWYKCSADKATCTRQWNDCCTLPGNTARTTIVTSPQTP